MYNGLDWEVQQYGLLYKQADIYVSRNHISTKVYIYKDNFYAEIWINDIRYLFQPLD